MFNHPNKEISTAHDHISQWSQSREGISVQGSGPSVPLCDYCGIELDLGGRTGHYAAQTNLLADEGEDQPLTFQRHYCRVCRRDNITKPCKGTLEVVVSHDLCDEYRVQDIEIEDISTRSDGLSWDPEAVIQNVLHVPTSQISGAVSNEVGPEAVVDALALYGVPPEQVLRANGEIAKEAVCDRVSKQMESLHEQLLSMEDRSPPEWVQEQPYPPTGRVELP